MIRLAAATLCAALALPASAQDRFCPDDLSAMAGVEVGGEALSLVDPGYASAMQMHDAGFTNFEVFRGPDTDGLEATLRGDTDAIIALQTDCMARVPECIVLFFDADPGTGFMRRVVHSGLDQLEYRVLLGGEQLRVRATSNDPMPEYTAAAAKQLMTDMLQSHLPPCRE